MKIKTSELTGAALDWAVAKCEGVKLYSPPRESNPAYAYNWVRQLHGHLYLPSTDPSQAYPIIDRENISVRPVFHAERTENGSDVYRKDGWAAHVEPKAFWITPRPFAGPTLLIAAMRCYVSSKLGDTVEVPDELAAA